MKKSGDFLRGLREARGMTREEVAALLEIDVETIRLHEERSKPPSRGNTTRRMLEVYGSTMDQLWTAIGAARPHKLVADDDIIFGVDTIPPTAGEAPSANTLQEKTMDPLSLIRGLSTLDLDELDMLQALITRRMEQVQSAQNTHHRKSARSASA